MNFYTHIKGLCIPFFDRLLLIMKLVLLLTLITIMQATAASFAQTVTLSAHNVPLNEVMRTIQSQTGYLFFLKGKDIAYTKVHAILKCEDLHAANNKLLAKLPPTW